MEAVKVSPTYSVGSTTQVTLKRINKILYASINGGAEQQVIDFNNMTKPFYAPLTFGASLNGNGDPLRYYNGTISNISVQYIE